ncbi:MAG: hypothetical protein R3E79_03545 [Caldilineaceae bacterium]
MATCVAVVGRHCGTGAYGCVEMGFLLMPIPILATKLYIPPSRPNLVIRPRLIERLNDGLDGKLTLISAPAGFGKTTLVSSWIADLRLPLLLQDIRVNRQSAIVNRQSKIGNLVAWLSLDEEDGDPTRFLAYVIAALQTIDHGTGEGEKSTIGAEVLAVLQSPQPPVKRC